MTEAIIEVSGLRKRFGPVLALDGMSFTVRPGLVTGFVGPNGAGKSTTMRVVLGLDAAEAGHCAGRRPALPDPAAPADRGRIAAGRRRAAARPDRTQPSAVAGLFSGPARQPSGRGDRPGWPAAAARRKAGGYSLGMRQRLGVAAAMLGDPPVLMLDEPFNGLDPEGIVWMRGFLRSLAGQGRAVLVSSHLMSELEDTADHLVIVGRGKVIADTSTAGLLAAASGDRVTVRTAATAEATAVLQQSGATVAAAGSGTLRVSGLSAEKIVTLLGGRAVPFSEVSAHRASLEAAYLELTRDAVEYRAEPATEVAR